MFSLTRIPGFIAILAALGCIAMKIAAHDYMGILECLAGLSAGAGVAAAKPWNLTGGTVPATVEAEKRTTTAAAKPVRP